MNDTGSPELEQAYRVTCASGYWCCPGLVKAIACAQRGPDRPDAWAEQEGLFGGCDDPGEAPEWLRMAPLGVLLEPLPEPPPEPPPELRLRVAPAVADGSVCRALLVPVVAPWLGGALVDLDAEPEVGATVEPVALPELGAN